MSDPGTRFAAVVVNGDPAQIDTLTGLLSEAGIETTA